MLDPKLSGPLGLIAEVALLKEHGVEKIYHLSDRLDTDCKNIVYLIRPRCVERLRAKTALCPSLLVPGRMPLTLNGLFS